MISMSRGKNRAGRPNDKSARRDETKLMTL